VQLFCLSLFEALKKKYYIHDWFLKFDDDVGGHSLDRKDADAKSDEQKK
jgi:hypothetical protein